MKKLITTLLTLATLTACSSNKMNNAKIIYCKASSTLNQGSGRYSISKLFDGNVKTCWAEGKAGPGIGTRILIRFDKPVEINKLYIVNGLGINKYHKKNNRVKKMYVNGQAVTLEDTKAGKYQTISLPHTIKGRQIVIEIVSIYKTNKWNDTCISEIAFSSDKNSSKTPRLINRKNQFLIGRWTGGGGGMTGNHSEDIFFYANNTYTCSMKYAYEDQGSWDYKEKGRWKRVGNTIYMTVTEIIKKTGRLPHPPSSSNRFKVGNKYVIKITKGNHLPLNGNISGLGKLNKWYY